MPSFVDRCRFNAASGGTGSLVVASAVTGYMTPAQAGAVNGTLYSYAAQSADNTSWEIGTGTYTVSGTVLTRSPTFSSNANALVNFAVAPAVTLTPLAADLAITASPPSSLTAAGTTGQLEIDPVNGNLWVCVATNKWQVFKGSYGRYISFASPQACVIDVTDQPYRSLVVPNGISPGVDDWLPALNAASAYILANGTIGTIVLPPFTISISDSWKIGDTQGTGPGTGTAVSINIEGSGGSGLSSINYYGPLDGRPGIWIAKNKRFRLQNFSLSQLAFTNPGTSVGLALGGSITAVGATECTGGVLLGINISGFQQQISDYFGAASELTMINLFLGRAASSFGLGYNTAGASFDFFNSTNHTYILPTFFNLDIGLDATNATMINVFSANTSVNSIDIKAGGRCRLLVDGLRLDNFGAVTTGRVFVGSSGQLTARNIRVPSANGGDNIAISGTFRQFALYDSIVNGYIVITGAFDSVTMINNKVWPNANSKTPFIAAGTTYGVNAVFLKGNTYTSGDVADNTPAASRVQMPDFSGKITVDDLGSIYFDPTIWLEKTGNTDSFAAGNIDTYGQPFQALAHVRCLSETQLNGFMDATGATAYTYTGGKNLRIQGAFATSNSLALTFQRTVSLTIPGLQQVQLGSGTFFKADVGKQLFIAGGGNPSGDFYGMVHVLASSTIAYVLPANTQHPPNYAGSKSAVLGANEPDANYMVFVTGNVNETFWVDTITATGFTVHSSNAASIATITCLIIR